MQRRIPDDLASADRRMLGLFKDEMDAFEDAQAVLLADVRFEHMGKTIEDRVWRFVCQCDGDREHDFVGNFVSEHGQEPTESVCYIPVESLEVDEEVQLPGMSLLPVADGRLPPAHPGFSLERPVSSVAAVSTSGTDYGRMAERARAVTEHALRALRVGMREHYGVPEQQLRFRLAHSYSFGEGLVGWSAAPDVRWGLKLDAELLGVFESQAVSGMPLEPATDIEKKADVALVWIERAMLETDEVTTLLYLFFALEALLGDRSEGLKAHGLAFRRAMLSIAISERFAHPRRAYLLYDEVRSAAVHGGRPPAIERSTVVNFAADVRRALNEFLEFAEANDFQRRGRLLKALEEHPERGRFSEWLRENDGPTWRDYLDRFDATPEHEM